MTTIWNYRGDDRALWAVIAAIVAPMCWPCAWRGGMPPGSGFRFALPVAVLLIWFFLAEAGVRDLGFPRPGIGAAPQPGRWAGRARS